MTDEGRDPALAILRRRWRGASKIVDVDGRGRAWTWLGYLPASGSPAKVTGLYCSLAVGQHELASKKTARGFQPVDGGFFMLPAFCAGVKRRSTYRPAR